MSAADPSFADREARIAHYAELDELLRGSFAAQPRVRWLGRLEPHDLPATAIHYPAEERAR